MQSPSNQLGVPSHLICSQPSVRLSLLLFNLALLFTLAIAKAKREVINHRQLKLLLHLGWVDHHRHAAAWASGLQHLPLR